MALHFPNGTVIGFSTAFDALTVAASSVSNADPAVATATAGALTAGEIVVVSSSSWASLANRVAEVGTETTGAFPLLGIDTTDTNLFPTGEGDAVLMVATAFVDFSQQGDLSTSGGEQQFWNGQFLEDRSGRQLAVPTFKNAKSFQLPLYYDPDLPWYEAAKRADARKEPVILRMRLPSGDTLYRYGYLSFDADPSMNANNPMQNQMTFSALGDASRVESV